MEHMSNIAFSKLKDLEAYTSHPDVVEVLGNIILTASGVFIALTT